jgi:hypothetical protein
MYKSAQELKLEAVTRIEKLYAEAESYSLLKQHQALPRQRMAAWLRKLADHLDLSTSSTPTLTKANQ